MTPSDICLGFSSHNTCQGESWRIAAEWRPASKSLALHRSIYEADRGASCVIHTHSTHLVALTLSGVWSSEDILPPITPYYVMKVGHVPLIHYHRPGDPAAGLQVAGAIDRMRARKTPIHAVMLDRSAPTFGMSHRGGHGRA